MLEYKRTPKTTPHAITVDGHVFDPNRAVMITTSTDGAETLWMMHVDDAENRWFIVNSDGVTDHVDNRDGRQWAATQAGMPSDQIYLWFG